MYAIVINPASGREQAANLYQKVEQQLISDSLQYEAFLSDSSEASYLFLENLLVRVSLTAIIVIGGDGTVGSVVQLAAEHSIPLALLPAGSGNDTARAFRLTRDPSVFVRKLKELPIRSVDLLNVNGKLGITIAAAGIDAEIGEKANHSFYKRILKKAGLGGLAYPIAAIQTLFVYTPFHVSIYVDGRSLEWPRTWLIAAGNTPSYGGGLYVCPAALTNDGVMNITVAHTASRQSLLLSLFPKLLLGNPIHSPSITYLTAVEMTLEADRNVLLILDGEPIHSPRFSIRLLPDALSLVDTGE